MEDSEQIVAKRQTIFPDGCPEMIFHFGGLYRQYLKDGTAVLQPRCFVMGQLTGPLDIEPTGKTDIFSVRFHPDGFLPFASNNTRSAVNTALPLNQIFGTDGEHLFLEMLKARSTAEK